MSLVRFTVIHQGDFTDKRCLDYYYKLNPIVIQDGNVDSTHICASKNGVPVCLSAIKIQLFGNASRCIMLLLFWTLTVYLKMGRISGALLALRVTSVLCHARCLLHYSRLPYFPVCNPRHSPRRSELRLRKWPRAPSGLFPRKTAIQNNLSFLRCFSVRGDCAGASKLASTF